jgi:hypothetical protein
MYAHVVHAHAMHNPLYLRINSDMATVALVPKTVLVEKHLSVTSKYNE